MRGFWRRIGALTAILTTLTAPEAFAQGAIQQSGAIVPFHAGGWFGNGVLADAGTPAKPYLNSLGLFNGANCPFGISSQTTPGASLTPYSQFTICQTATTTTLNFTGVNGQTTPNVYFNVGGAAYPFPGPGNGTVVGPSISTANGAACFSNTTGTVLTNCPSSFIVPLNSMGVSCTGADETTAIQAALNSGATQIGLPTSGTCAASTLTIPAGVTVIGSSQQSGCLEHTVASGTFITLNSASQLRNLCLGSTVLQTSGVYLQISGNNATVSDITSSGHFLFSQVGNVSVQAVHSSIININAFNPAVGAGSGLIMLNNYSSALIDNVVGVGTGSGIQPDFGIEWLNGDTSFVSNVNITRMGQAIRIAPNANQNVYASYLNNVIGDSGGTTTGGASAPSCAIFPLGNGNVYETNISNIWCGLSLGADGLLMQSSSGVISGVNIVNYHFNGNFNSGIHIDAGVKYVNVSNGEAGGNVHGAGFSLTAAATHIQFSGCMCGPDPARSIAPNNYGIDISVVAADYLNIGNNDTVGNTTANYINGATGAHQNVTSLFQ